MISKQKLLDKAKSINIEARNKIVDEIIAEWDNFEQQLSHLKKIDIKGVKPMHRIDERTISNLRLDKPEIPFSNEVFVKNAPQIKNGYVAIKRVVNND